MRLTGLAFRPSAEPVSNDALIEAVLAHSAFDQHAADQAARTLRRLLDYSGGRHRYWTPTPDDIGQLITTALDAALVRGGKHRDDVDLLISTMPTGSFLPSVLRLDGPAALRTSFPVRRSHARDPHPAG